MNNLKDKKDRVVVMRILVNFETRKVVHCTFPPQSDMYKRLTEQQAYILVGTVKGVKMKAYWLKEFFKSEAKYLPNEEYIKTIYLGLPDPSNPFMDGV